MPPQHASPNGGPPKNTRVRRRVPFIFLLFVACIISGTFLGSFIAHPPLCIRDQEEPIVYEKGSCKVEMVGGTPGNNNNTYGAWPVCTNLLPPEPLVYSFGIGGDISFDVAIVRDHNARTVFCYDPTISNERFAKLSEGKNKNLLFTQIGAGALNEVVHFYKSTNPIIESLVSTPGLKGYQTEPYLTAAIHDLQSIAAINRHKWVDLIKLDVEGKEFDIFLNMDLRALPTSHILIEFHARFFDGGWEKQAKVYHLFEEAGWELAYEQPERKEEAVFIRVAE